MAVDGRQAALDNALKQIEKDFGKVVLLLSILLLV